MRIALYSDLQLHPYEAFSRIENSINNRLQDHILVLNQILDYCIKEQIQYLIFGGDAFEERKKVDVVAAKLFAEWKHRVSQAGIRQIDVVGNHDLRDKSTFHNSLEIYRHINNLFVCSEPQWINLLNGCAVFVIPWRHRLDEIQAALKFKPRFDHDPAKSIAVLHYGIYDVVDNGRVIVADEGNDTEGQIRLTELDELLKVVANVFVGHYHAPVDLSSRVHFIGTPIQHNFGESHIDTRFLDIDLDNGTFKGIPTTSPRFYKWNKPQEIELSKIAGNFCRVEECENQEQRAKILELFKQAGARGSDAFLVKKKPQSESRLGLNLAMSFQEMGERMVDSDNTLLDKARLKKVFGELLSATVKQ